jgi:hypothetical protein
MLHLEDLHHVEAGSLPERTFLASTECVAVTERNEETRTMMTMIIMMY